MRNTFAGSHTEHHWRCSKICTLEEICIMQVHDPSIWLLIFSLTFCCLLAYVCVQVHDFAENNDSILLVVIPAASCQDVSASRALKLAQDLDPDGKSNLPHFACSGWVKRSFSYVIGI
jgi:hypothetical protein